MFKVGDRVIPKDPEWEYGDGVIVAIDMDVYFQVKYNISCVICGNIPCSSPISTKWHRLFSIERVITKNQQLEFSFMCD